MTTPQQPQGNPQVDQNTDPGVTDDEARQLLGVDNDTPDDDGGSEQSGTDDKAAAEAAKWKALSRKNEKALKDALAKLKEHEDAKLSEAERQQKERDRLKADYEKAQAELSRMRIAAETAPEGATLAQMRKVAKRMTGDDDAALEADAKELWEDFGPGRPTSPKPPTSKPQEKLRGGGNPDDEDEVGLDPLKLAQLIPRAR